jgi:hypothetical protein
MADAIGKWVHVDVQHHDHEQEQHHDGTDVDQYQHDGQELGLEQHPDAGGVEERQHQEQRRGDRVAGRDNAGRGNHHDGREHVEQSSFKVHN